MPDAALPIALLNRGPSKWRAMLLLAAFRLCPDVGNLLIHPHEQRVAYARKCQLVSTPEIPASGTCAKQGSRQQRNGPMDQKPTSGQLPEATSTGGSLYVNLIVRCPNSGFRAVSISFWNVNSRATLPA